MARSQKPRSEARGKVVAVMKRHLTLTYRGFFVPLPREAEDDQAVRLDQGRAGMLDLGALDQFDRCCQFINKVLTIQAFDGEVVSSEYLRQTVEEWGVLEGRPMPVSPGMLITAMAYEFAPPRDIDGAGCAFRLAAADVVAVQDIRQKAETASRLAGD
jgi:hypothetical protein